MVSSGYRVNKTTSLPSGSSLSSRRKRRSDKYLVRNKAEHALRAGTWVVAVLHVAVREAFADEQRWQEVRGVWCRQGEPLHPESGELQGGLVAEALAAKGGEELMNLERAQLLRASVPPSGPAFTPHGRGQRQVNRRSF